LRRTVCSAFICLSIDSNSDFVIGFDVVPVL
jgi:hypothetical protein